MSRISEKECYECGSIVNQNNSISNCIHDLADTMCRKTMCYVCWYKRIESYDNNGGEYVRCKEHNKRCNDWVNDNYSKILSKALYMLLAEDGVTNPDIFNIIDKLKK